METLEPYLSRHLKLVPGNGPERKCHCPNAGAHSNGDRNPSASVNVIVGLFKCFACDLQGGIRQIAEKLNWDDPPRSSSTTDPFPMKWQGRQIKERYRYESEDGTPLYYVCRVEWNEDGSRHKDFTVHDANGRWGLRAKANVREHDIERVLYRLPALKDAETVFIAEGEKDVHAMESLGFVATCSPGGAGKWEDVYSAYLEGKEAVILTDNDEAGRKHGQQVAKSLHGMPFPRDG